MDAGRTTLSLIATAFALTGLLGFGAPRDLPEIEWNENQESGGQLVDGRLLLDLEVRRGLWRPLGEEGDSVEVLAFGEVGNAPSIPGPMIRVPEGTEVVATMRNSLDTPLELQGLSSRLYPDFDVENTRNHAGEDLPTVVIAPGETRELRFTADTRGTYMYRGFLTGSPTATEPFEGSMLQGALIVDAPDGGALEHEKVMVMQVFFGDSTAQGFPDEGQELLTINGRPWPHTERLTYDMGDEIPWRVINASFLVHPMHLHGFFYDVLSRGDVYQDTVYRSTQVRKAVTERMEPFTTMKVRWTPDRPGGWIFHCHLTNHVLPNPGLVGDLPSNIDRLMELVRDDGSHGSGDHMTEGMGGLVVGIEIRAPEGWAPVETEAEPVRVHIREDSVPGHAMPRFGFALGAPGEPPPGDQVPFPSPPLVLHSGEPAAVRVVNDTDEPTTTHWHGLEVESLYDGVAGLAGYGGRRAPVIMPGDSFDVFLRTDRPGTYIYHTHTADMRQQAAGLYGPLIVLPEGQSQLAANEWIAVAGLGVGEEEELSGRVYLNGWSEPEPMPLVLGREYRLRLINITPTRGNLEFRLTRDGYPVSWRRVEKDAWAVPLHQQDLLPARQPVSVGETYDFAFTPRNTGDLKLEIRTGAGDLLVAQEAHVVDPGPLTIPLPEGWNAGSTYQLPPHFAPEIPQEGVLQFRFAPGMFEEGDEQFSYLMAWWLTGGPPIDDAEVECLLETYFTGLALSNATDRVEPGAAEATIRADPVDNGLGLTGTVATFDPFVTKAPVILNVRGRFMPCASAEGSGLLLEISPQPLDHPIWQELETIRQETRC